MKKINKKETYKYNVEMKFNEIVHKKETNDIAKTLLSFKPEQLYTDMFITIKSGDNLIERHLNLQQGKNLFRNEDFFQIFINNLML